MKSVKRLGAARTLKTKSLILAIIFFFVSAAAISLVIELNNKTEKYLVASRDLPAGSAFQSADGLASSFNLGGSADLYLRESELPAEGYLLGPVRSGQLIPRSMIATAVIDERVPVVVNSAMGLSAGLVPGASVDVWVSPKLENQVFGEPFILVIGAEVSQIFESSEMFANKSSSVEIWVPVEAVGPVLNSISSGASISLILKPTLADG